ncbi:MULTISPECIES: hypothetical protein [unclassified Comamonas]|uniref:hypothetical protein n=1 Tax=unclassified Comamonas TaxID=2638500 RepID=UPI001FA6EB30|nr:MULTISPECIES: hypothetical protein [unclassified Comamonas]UNV89403.1 hypothetical protein MP576_17565 [Comamonas sp. 7D-2evo1]UNV97299.1 hypothetical protein MPZ60_08840 [Comamonas sp. 7D-2]UNV99047.1 hypothetical protein MP579_17570 [Comamonas sp. 7D-2evo2]
MQTARVTMPSVPITSPEFVYRNSGRTDVAQTWERHRQAMAAQQQANSTVRKPRKRPPVMTIRHVRAGTTGHLNLSLFNEAAPC